MGLKFPANCWPPAVGAPGGGICPGVPWMSLWRRAPPAGTCDWLFVFVPPNDGPSVMNVFWYSDLFGSFAPGFFTRESVNWPFTMWISRHSSAFVIGSLYRRRRKRMFDVFSKSSKEAGYFFNLREYSWMARLYCSPRSTSSSSFWRCASNAYLGTCV